MTGGWRVPRRTFRHVYPLGTLCHPGTRRMGAEYRADSKRRLHEIFLRSSILLISSRGNGPKGGERGRYENMVLTAKHHDGFCLFDSQYTRFQIHQHEMRPRPCLQEYVDAVRAEGLKVGLYFSCSTGSTTISHITATGTTDAEQPGIQKTMTAISTAT